LGVLTIGVSGMPYSIMITIVATFLFVSGICY
jgi:hypothetical protein